MGPYRNDLETAHAKIARLEATVQQLTEERARRDRSPAPVPRPSSPWRTIAFVAGACVTIVGIVSLSPPAPPAHASRPPISRPEPSPPVRAPEPPSAIPPLPEPAPGGPHDIHSTERGVLENLLLDERALVWTGDGTIRTLDLASNQVRTLASGIQGSRAVAMNSTHVYWAGWRAGTVMRVARDGGAPEVVADIGERLPNGMVLTSTHVYWTEFIGAVRRMPLDGGPVEDLRWEPSEIVTSPQIRGNYLYVLATRGEVRRLQIGPDPELAPRSQWQTITILDGSTLLTEIVLDDEYVYGLSVNGSFVFRSPLEGSSMEILTHERQSLGIAIAGDWLYMTTAQGVTRMPRAGGPIENVAPGSARAIAVGRGRVYFSTEDPYDLNLGSIESTRVVP